MHGHNHSSSVSQNHKAQLANAYNELGKELSSPKIRVVGNYTLGRTIGEGMRDRFCASPFHAVSITLEQVLTGKSDLAPIALLPPEWPLSRYLKKCPLL